jgi:Zn-dependent protease with chaperone function
LVLSQILPNLPRPKIVVFAAVSVRIFLSLIRIQAGLEMTNKNKNWLLIFAVFGISLLIAGCSHPNLKPLTSDTTLQSLEKDENDVWKAADYIEQNKGKTSADFNGQELAETYLQDVVHRLTADFNNAEIRIRVYVILDTSPNAFVLPNGAVFVTTGMIAALENEAQLAFILSHEFQHFKCRHHIEESRTSFTDIFVESMNTPFYSGETYYDDEDDDDGIDYSDKNLDVLFTSIAVNMAVDSILGGNSEDYNNNSNDINNSCYEENKLYARSQVLWARCLNSWFSKKHEKEADKAALADVIKAGYEPNQSLRAYKLLKRYYSKAGYWSQTEFFSHHAYKERITTCKKLLAGKGNNQSTHELNTGAYYTMLSTVIYENARLNNIYGRKDIAMENIRKCITPDPNYYSPSPDKKSVQN